MYDQIRTKTGMGIGVSPEENRMAKQNIAKGYVAGSRIPNRIVNETDYNPIKIPYTPIKDKTVFLDKVHQEMQHKLVDKINGQELYRAQTGRMTQLQPLDRRPLYGGGGGRDQLDNIEELLAKRMPYGKSIYSMDDSRQLAKIMLGSVGFMPQQTINQNLERLNDKLNLINVANGGALWGADLEDLFN